VNNQLKVIAYLYRMSIQNVIAVAGLHCWKLRRYSHRGTRWPLSSWESTSSQ